MTRKRCRASSGAVCTEKYCSISITLLCNGVLTSPCRSFQSPAQVECGTRMLQVHVSGLPEFMATLPALSVFVNRLSVANLLTLSEYIAEAFPWLASWMHGGAVPPRGGHPCMRLQVPFLPCVMSACCHACCVLMAVAVIVCATC
jgi:hypothetical protein